MTLNQFCSWQIPRFQESLLSDVIRPIVVSHLKRFQKADKTRRKDRWAPKEMPFDSGVMWA